MPRRATGDLTPLHFVDPGVRNANATSVSHRGASQVVWVLDSYRIRTWYYRDAPNVGDRVRFLRDGFDGTIDTVTWSHISFNGLTVRRPAIARRMLACQLPRLSKFALSLFGPGGRFRGSVTTSSPSPVTLYV